MLTCQQICRFLHSNEYFPYKIYQRAKCKSNGRRQQKRYGGKLLAFRFLINRYKRGRAGPMKEGEYSRTYYGKRRPARADKRLAYC